jgi:hypothetical protein
VIIGLFVCMPHIIKKSKEVWGGTTKKRSYNKYVFLWV